MHTAKPYLPGDAERELTLTRVYDAPRETVFRAWTDPAQMACWWGPQGFTNPVCEVDARPGGRLRIVMRAADGSEYPLRGEFREVVVPERLSFTNVAVDARDQPIIDGFTTVSFSAEGTKTRVTVVTRATAVTCGKAVAPVAIQYLQGMEAGWSQSFDKLSAWLSARQAGQSGAAALDHRYGRLGRGNQ